jgi:hypothetical protein
MRREVAMSSGLTGAASLRRQCLSAPGGPGEGGEFLPICVLGHPIKSNTINHPVGREQFTHVLLGDGEREIPKINLHRRSLLG